MATNIRQMNKALYNAALHLHEAGKYLSNVEAFRLEATQLHSMADEMLSIIKPEPEKVTEDKMLSILDEILDEGEEDNGNG